MAPTSWKKCQKCGRKQPKRYLPVLCGACDADKRRKERREARKVLTQPGYFQYTTAQRGMMTQDSKALQDVFETIHYSKELVDTSAEEDETDPDDDEDYEPELTLGQQLGMMTDEEFEEFLDARHDSKNK